MINIHTHRWQIRNMHNDLAGLKKQDRKRTGNRTDFYERDGRSLSDTS